MDRFRDLVIFDPVAAGADRDRVRELIYELLPGAAFRGVAKGEKIRPDVERAVISGYDRIVVAGGDELVAEVADGMLYTGLPLGVAPLGRNHRFADSLGLPTEPRAACELLATGGFVREAAAMNLNGSLCLTGVTIGSQPGLARSWHFRIVIDGAVHRARAWRIVVGRSEAAGHGDAKLQIAVYRRSSLLTSLGALVRRLALGQARPAPIEQLEATREIRVESRSAMPVFGAHALPKSKVVVIENLPGALRVVTPGEIVSPLPSKPSQDSIA